jgi:hypothetical protein
VTPIHHIDPSRSTSTLLTRDALPKGIHPSAILLCALGMFGLGGYVYSSVGGAFVYASPPSPPPASIISTPVKSPAPQAQAPKTAPPTAAPPTAAPPTAAPPTAAPPTRSSDPSSPEASPPSSKLKTPKEDVIIRSGEIQWTADDVIKALSRFHLWLRWSRSDPPSVDALKDSRNLRQTMIKAIEREVLIREATARLPSPTPGTLRAWVIEKVPGTVRPSTEGLEDYVRGRLKLLPKTPIDDFWRSSEEMYMIDQLRIDLIKNLDEAEAQREWRRRGEKVRAWFIQVPRVPSSLEISRGIKKYRDDLQAYYEKNAALFSQPVRLLALPFWIKGGRTEMHRVQAKNVRDRLADGTPAQELFAQFPQLTQGGMKTLKKRGIPKRTKLKEGAITPLRLARNGWTFYQIKRVYASYTRSIKEISVQREISAAILRAKDDLPEARRLAEDARRRLSAIAIGSEAELRAWTKRERARFKQPQPFSNSLNQVIPQLGKAPELHDLLFTLREGSVTPVIKVRQNYVVARLIERKSREKTWAEARLNFMPRWRDENNPKVLDQWLSKTLKDQPRWVSSSGLKSLDIDALRPKPQPIPNLEKVLNKEIKGDRDQMKSPDDKRDGRDGKTDTKTSPNAPHKE